MRPSLLPGPLANTIFALLLVALAAFLPHAYVQRNLNVAPAAPTEQRVALVIGGAVYKDAPLRNPVNGAAATA